MSAVERLAKPHRIKAAHRRRWKCSTGSRLYANDNPYRYTDPFGLYSCGSKVSSGDCGKIGAFVGKLNDALKKMNHKSASYKKLSAISSYLGKPGQKNGVTITVGKLAPNVVGDANTNGTGFKLDMNKLNNLPKAFQTANPKLSSSTIENAYGASVVAHESQHELDIRANGGYPHGKQARSGFHGLEEDAYGVQSTVGKALGVRIGLETTQQVQDAVQQSTNGDCASSTPQC